MKSSPILLALVVSIASLGPQPGLAEAGVEVAFDARLDLGAGGVEQEGRRIVAFRTEDGRRFAGTMFIDATYEGDLMAKAGVAYHVGREAEGVYGESLNGIRTACADKHQFTRRVDPFVVPGDPTSYIGANYDYPEAGHAEREKIVAAHRRYQTGLMWTLANHPRVPEKVRGHFQRLGLAKDEFTDNDNWPHQLYVREARRMVSDHVMTQDDCEGKRAAEDSVGLGAYNMDSHNCQRYVTAEGTVRNEGDIQVGVKPYRISFRSIRPRREECENLLVPVCLAASHIAYGSIRMEPVFMVLGQSAATAAVLAIDAGTAVQDVEYRLLRERLFADGQILEWGDRGGASPAPPRPAAGR